MSTISAKATVTQIGKNVNDVQGDVSNLADLDRLYTTVMRQKGRIDVLFANAGLLEFGPMGTITEAHFDKIFSVNGTESASAFSGRRFDYSKCFGRRSSVYSATKVAVRSFARTWAVDLKQRKIRVNAISPGPIDTSMLSGLVQREESREYRASGTNGKT